MVKEILTSLRGFKDIHDIMLEQYLRARTERAKLKWGYGMLQTVNQ